MRFYCKKMTNIQAESLFSTGKTEIIKGFTSKAGKKFDTALILDIVNNQVKFNFATRQ